MTSHYGTLSSSLRRARGPWSLPVIKTILSLACFKTADFGMPVLIRWAVKVFFVKSGAATFSVRTAKSKQIYR